MLSIILLLSGGVVILAMIDAAKRIVTATETTALIMAQLYRERERD
jgi:hypothetical protein